MNNANKLNLEKCYEYVENNIFTLRPHSYDNTYPGWPGLVGLEVEMLLISSKTIAHKKPSLIKLFHSNQNITSTSEPLINILEHIAQKNNWTIKYYEESFYNLKLIDKILTSNEDSISFEPGGQFEYSSKPKPCLNDAIENLKSFQSKITQEFSLYDILALQIGINPWHNVDQIGLQQPKSRYKAMHEYFCTIGSYGLRMMRQTCTIQINLDFGADENTLVKRFLASNLIAPFATAIFAYSPFCDTHISQYDSFRSKCWQYLDKTRTGFYDLNIIYKNFNKESCVKSYIDFLMNANVIYLTSLNFKVNKQPISFKEWLLNGIEGVFPTLDDLENHCSLIFPEVRARGFIELRSIDCQSVTWQFVPAIFYTSLLYDKVMLDKVLNLLIPYISDINDLWHKCTFGLEDDLIFNLSKTIMNFAEEGITRLPSCYNTKLNVKLLHLFNTFFTQNRLNPARYLKNYIIKNNKTFLTAKDILKLEEFWQNYIDKN